MDCGVSVSKSPNSSTKIQTNKVSMPSSSKESTANADYSTNSWLDSNQSFMAPPVVNSKDISVSVNETLDLSMTMSIETNNVSSPSSSEEIPVIAGNPISRSRLDSDQSPTALPVTSSQYIGVSVNETLNSAMTDEIDTVSMLSFSQETPAKSDKPAKNSLGSDQSFMDSLVTKSQDTDSINETLNSSSSNEMGNACMPSSSKGIPVKMDNPIDGNSSEFDQSLLAPPSTNLQYIIFSVNETPNSAMSDGTAKVSMPSSEESLVIADDGLVEKSLDSDQSSMEPLVTNSQVTSVSIDETLSSASSNGNDKVCMPSSESPVNTDNPIDENTSRSDLSLLAPPSTNSQDISVSVNETPNSAISDGTTKISKPSSSKESFVTAEERLVENSLDSDQSFIVLPERKSQDIDVSVSERQNSSSSETDKVSNPSYSKESPVVADNPIAKNSLDSGQSSTPSPVTKSQDIVREENFYDCQAWLGSDSDDDFFSVKDDYSNASSRQSSMKGSPQLDEISVSKQEPYPSKGGKKLDEHFHDRKSMPPTIQETKLRKPKQEPSSIDENKKLAALLQNSSSTPVLKEIKLVEFFQDSHWSREMASIRAKRSPNTTGNAKLKSEVEAKHLSPRDGTSTVPREHPTTRYVGSNLKREDTARATHCCFPSWSPIHGSKERKRQPPPRSQR